jgi:hypothetical protein
MALQDKSLPERVGIVEAQLELLTQIVKSIPQEFQSLRGDIAGLRENFSA